MITASLKHIKDFHYFERHSKLGWGTGKKCEIGFYSSVVYLPKGTGYIGATRTGNGGLGDILDIINYDDEFNLLSKKELTKGEDPRTFIYNERPYVLTWSPNNKYKFLGMKQPKMLTYKLIDLLDRKVINLDIENFKSPSPMRLLGKNWMPLVKGNKLYFVLTIHPQITILECDVDSGKCFWVSPIIDVQNGLSISEYRGGTPFILDEKSNLFVGLGHRTYDLYNHKPFLYTLTQDFQQVTIGPDLITGKQDVEDPASIYKHNGKIFCCINNLRRGIREGELGLYELTLNQ